MDYKGGARAGQASRRNSGDPPSNGRGAPVMTPTTPRVLLHGPAASDLRRWLGERLPEPMVPSSYVLLEALPLLPNGKLDLSALPPPSSDTDDGSGTEFVPPRTTAEEILARTDLFTLL